MEGYIALHRELVDKPIWLNSTPEQKVILITLLLMANHKPNQWEWKGKQFCVQRGQMITSLESIKITCGKGITTQNIRTALVRFEKLEFLTDESTKEGRLITICNYSKYQLKEEQSNIAPNIDLTKGSQRGNKGVTSNNNDKKEKNEKKEKEDAEILPDFIDSVLFGEYLKMRTKIKKPMTDFAKKKAINKLTSMHESGLNITAIIEKSIFRCWLDFFPLDEDKKQKTKQPMRMAGS